MRFGTVASGWARAYRHRRHVTVVYRPSSLEAWPMTFAVPPADPLQWFVRPGLYPLTDPFSTVAATAANVTGS